MKALIIIITLSLSPVVRSEEGNLKAEENSEELIPKLMERSMALLNVTRDVMEEEMRSSPSGRQWTRSGQCSSSGCNYWEKIKLSAKVFFYFVGCESSNFGDREKAFLCLIDKIYGPNSEIKEECKPCICEITCSRKPSFCDHCKCGQDILIPAPNVVTCLTNVTKYTDNLSQMLCALTNYKAQANTTSLPASCVGTAGLLSCDVISDTLMSSHMPELIPKECLF